MNRRLRRVAAALAAAGLLWSAPAHADPITAIALVAQGIAVAGGATVLGVAISVSVATYVAIGASLVGGVMARRKAARAAAAAQRAASRESLQERTLVLQSSEPSPQIIYGRCAVGGAVLDRLSSAKTYVADDGTTKTRPDALQHIIIGLACHEITNVHRVFMLGEWLEFGADKWTTNTNFRKADSAHVTKSLAFSGAGQATIPDVPAGSTVSLVSITRELWPRPDTDTPTQSHTGATVSGSTISGGPTSGTWQVTYSLGNTSPRVRLEWFPGTTTQTASTYLKAANTRWTDAHRLQGIAYAILSLDLDDSRFQQGLPSDLTFDVSGKPLLDPRTGTTAYSDNTALAVYDWLRQPWGYNLTTDDINTSSVITAANACDALYYGTEKFSRISGAFKASDDRSAVLADLTENMGGFVAQGPLWSVHAGAWSAPVMTITDDDAAAPVQVPRSATDHDEAFNSARATIIPFGATQTEDVDPYINSTFVTADGGNEWQSFTLPFCPSKNQARSLLRQFVEQARAGMIVQYTGKMRLWRLEVGDRVTLTDSIHQISNKTFRVLDWSWAPGQPVTLTLQEDIAATYDQADAMDPDPAPNTSLPPPGTVSLPAGVTTTSGNSTLMQMSDGTIVPRVLVTWTRPTGIYMTSPGARTEIEWRQVSDTAWTALRVLGDVDRTWIDGVRDQAPILIRIRHVNSFGAESAWIIRAHIVAGKSALPTAPTALAVTEGVSGERIYSVTHVQDLDHAGYIVRASGVLTATWDQMAQVAAWAGATTQHRSGSPGDGVWRFAVRAVDTTGNLSVPVYVTATLTQQAIGWSDLSGVPGNLAGLTGAEQIRNDQLASSANMLFDSDFTAGPESWGLSGALPIVAYGRNWHADWTLNAGAGPSTGTIYMSQNGPSGGTYSEITSEPIAVLPGDRICASAYTGAHRCDVDVFAYFYGASGITGSTWGAGTMRNAAEASGGPALSGYKRCYSIGVAPAGTRTCRLVLRKYDTHAGQSSSWLFACRAQVEEVGANATSPGPWTPGPAAVRFGDNVYGQAQTSDIAEDAATSVLVSRYAGAMTLVGPDTGTVIRQLYYTADAPCKLQVRLSYTYEKNVATVPNGSDPASPGSVMSFNLTYSGGGITGWPDTAFYIEHVGLEGVVSYTHTVNIPAAGEFRIFCYCTAITGITIYLYDRLCCTNPRADALTPTPDGLMPRHPPARSAAGRSD